MSLTTITVPIVTAGICIASFLSSGSGQVSGYSNYWESADSYVYYTQEDAVFEGIWDGVAYFDVSTDGVSDWFGAYVWDAELQDGDEVKLVFENRESKIEYLQAEEYGIETKTRRDNGRIVEIR